MEAFFNELSIYPLASDNDLKTIEDRVNGLFQLYVAIANKGFKKVRVSENYLLAVKFSNNFTLQDYIFKNPLETKQKLLLSMTARPYFKDNSLEEKEFVSKSYVLADPPSFLPQVSLYGLVAAYLHNSIAINLNSHTYWNTNKELELIVDNTKHDRVTTLSDCSDLDCAQFRAWCVKNLPRNYRKSSFDIEQKECKLCSTHHGNNKLRIFAKQSLLRLTFIDGVTKSAPYGEDNDNKFVIQKFSQDFSLKVCLFWEEPKCSMIVKTTASNDIELEQMSEDLERKFGRRKKS